MFTASYGLNTLNVIQVNFVFKVLMQWKNKFGLHSVDKRAIRYHSNGIRHESLLTARKLSANLYDIYHCCVYSEKLLMMDRGTVRNMQSFIPEINLRN